MKKLPWRLSTGAFGRRLMSYLRAAFKYRASRLAELSLCHIQHLWQSDDKIQTIKSVRRDLIEAWTLYRHQLELVALPSKFLQEVIRKNADCFAVDGVNDLVDEAPSIPVSPTERGYLSRLLFRNMSSVRWRVVPQGGSKQWGSILKVSG